MFFKFRNTSYATKERFAKEQKAFAWFWSDIPFLVDTQTWYLFFEGQYQNFAWYAIL